MEIEKLSKKFYDIVNISFKGENVKVLRNKKNFKWLFLKEENGALLPLPKNINKELHEIYSSDGGDYEVSITDCEFFDCNVKNVNLKNFGIMEDEVQTSSKGLSFEANGEKIRLKIVSVAPKNQKNRFPKEDDFEFINNAKQILKDYGFNDEKVVELLKKLDGYTIYLDDSCPNVSHNGKCWAGNKEIHVLTTRKIDEDKTKKYQFNDAEIQGTLLHEIFHSFSYRSNSFHGVAKYTYNPIQNNFTVFMLALNEGITGFLAKSGYNREQEIIKFLVGEKLPKEWIAAYFNNAPEKLIDYFKSAFKSSEDEFKEFASVMDSLLNNSKAKKENRITQEEYEKNKLKHEEEIFEHLLKFKINEKNVLKSPFDVKEAREALNSIRRDILKIFPSFSSLDTFKPLYSAMSRQAKEDVVDELLSSEWLKLIRKELATSDFNKWYKEMGAKNNLKEQMLKVFYGKEPKRYSQEFIKNLKSGNVELCREMSKLFEVKDKQNIAVKIVHEYGRNEARKMFASVFDEKSEFLDFCKPEFLIEYYNELFKSEKERARFIKGVLTYKNYSEEQIKTFYEIMTEQEKCCFVVGKILEIGYENTAALLKDVDKNNITSISHLFKNIEKMSNLSSDPKHFKETIRDCILNRKIKSNWLKENQEFLRGIIVFGLFEKEENSVGLKYCWENLSKQAKIQLLLEKIDDLGIEKVRETLINSKIVETDANEDNYRKVFKKFVDVGDMLEYLRSNKDKYKEKTFSEVSKAFVEIKKVEPCKTDNISFEQVIEMMKQNSERVGFPMSVILVGNKGSFAEFVKNDHNKK